MAKAEREVVWSPRFGPQEALISCPVFEVFYGGARGGGKTEGSIGDWLQHSGEWGEAAVGVFFRRRLRQLSEVIARTKIIFRKIGASYNEQKSEWTMPNGARLLFRYLERDSDAEEYQGHNYTRIYVEEVTNFPSPAPINKLRATLRTTAPGLQVGMRLTGNPGGPGHGWVKKRYIDPAPEGYKPLREEFENPWTKEKIYLERMFIPSRLDDNTAIENPSMYMAQLQQAGSKNLVRAWLLGDWSIIDGAFFSEFDPEKHILPAEWLGRIPKKSLVFRAFDHGYARPFSVGWYAVSDGSWGLPNGAIVRFEEWYGYDGKPNEGLRMDSGLVAQGIRAKEVDIKKMFGFVVRYGVADPSIFIRDGGPSIMEMMAKNGTTFRKADNKREPGWQQVRRRLIGVDGKPLLYFIETCEEIIRTLPLLQHDEKDTEDLDTDGEDHAADELRYACMSRPWVIDTVPQYEIPFPAPPGRLTFSDLLKKVTKKRLQEENRSKHCL